MVKNEKLLTLFLLSFILIGCQGHDLKESNPEKLFELYSKAGKSRDYTKLTYCYNINLQYDLLQMLQSLDKAKRSYADLREILLAKYQFDLNDEDLVKSEKLSNIVLTDPLNIFDSINIKELKIIYLPDDMKWCKVVKQGDNIYDLNMTQICYTAFSFRAHKIGKYWYIDWPNHSLYKTTLNHMKNHYNKRARFYWDVYRYIKDNNTNLKDVLLKLRKMRI